MRWMALVGILGGCMVGEPPPAVTALAPAVPGDAFATLNDPAAAHAELCAHDATDTTFPDNADRITNRFCQDVKGGAIPTPTSLDELLKVLDLDFATHSPAFALLGHSSALTARKVSSITPTAFVFTPLAADGTVPRDYVFVAFDPGEPFLEVASYSPADMAVNFYLVLFDKACMKTAQGCGPDDLLTRNQVTGWSNIRIYESTTALNNTIADCRQCHIGTGKDVPDTGDPLILRMQELEAPHTHWMSTATTGGQALLQDFHAAHGTEEDYGPIPAAMIDRSDPDQMAAFIKAAGFGDQPNAFHSDTIEQEVMASAPKQPWNDVPIGWSATWAGSFADATAGKFIPMPYHDVKITDPTKLAKMTAAYQGHLAGAPLTEDIRDVFLDAGLPEMGFAPLPAMTGRQLLAQQCQECHHSRLDPTISRENFLVDRLEEMSRAEKDLAIERINTPVDTRLTMPPPLFRTLGDRERQLMIEELQK